MPGGWSDRPAVESWRILRRRSVVPASNLLVCLPSRNDHAPTGAGACRIEAGPSVQCSLSPRHLGGRFALSPPRAADDAEARDAQAQQRSRARLGDDLVLANNRAHIGAQRANDYVPAIPG